MKPSDLTVTDQFCGAGGSSVGAEAVGLRLHLAMNHWQRAIETHSTNFPHAAHVCADISTTDPRRFPSTNILITSPECTNHSQAKSRKAHATLFDPHGADMAERSRATMMDVPRFAEYHDYEIVVVENVAEVVTWAGFMPWLQYMHNLGYQHRLLSLNSLIAHPTPQSRDRLYVIFWKAKNRAPDLDFRPPSWCPTCERSVDGHQSFRRAGRSVGKYRQQYDYLCLTCRGIVYPYAYPAAAAIDWSLPAERIGDRARPLAPATRRRVEIGLERFGRPTIVQAAGHTYEAPGSGYARVWPATDPLPAQTATLSHALALPAFFVKNYGVSDEAKYRAQPMSDPLGAITTHDSHSLVTMPFLAVLRTHQDARSLDEPLPTLVAGNVGMALCQPFIAELRGGRSDARPVSDPLATVCAGGNHHALVAPAFYVKNYGPQEKAGPMAHDVAEPFGTMTARDSTSLVTLPFLTSYYGTGTASDIREPMPTSTSRDHHALVEPSHEVDDCGFRMLAPHEIQAAMAFGADYVVTGNKGEQVRQLGNAVTPPVMRMILDRCVEALTA